MKDERLMKLKQYLKLEKLTKLNENFKLNPTIDRLILNLYKAYVFYAMDSGHKCLVNLNQHLLLVSLSLKGPK